jgi:magnesium transporter
MSQELLERFRLAVGQREARFITDQMKGMKSADISVLLHEFNTEESKYVMDLLPVQVQSEIIRDLESETRRDYLKVYTSAEIAALVNYLDSDDAADLLSELPVKTREQVIAGLDKDLRHQVTELLIYEENVAGGLMAKELIKARATWTVVECVEEIRKQAEQVSKFYAVYVVDENDILLGRVALQKIILSDPRTLIGDITDKDLVSVETYLEDTEVAEIMRKYDLESVPVVNVQGQLVGRITIDDVVDVITEQADEDRQAMSGISEDVEEDDSVWKLSRARLPWLIVGIVGGVISAQFIELFEGDLLKITAIAFFIPLIQATGGNVGIQSSSIVVQSLASPGIVEEDTWSRLVKVFLVAVINGVMLSLLVLGALLLLDGDTRLAIIVSIALFSVVFVASFVGTFTPLILNRMGFNPALASGPFITTTNDLIGLAVYFLAIHLLL